MEMMFEYLGTAWDGFLVYVLSFILVLSILVFVHEWGHYIVAKMCGVKITAFSIGFGKELFGFNDKSGTRWRVAAIPLGGYVQMFGDADPSSHPDDEKVKELTEEEKQVAFYHKALWKRAAIVFAGPGINFLFAILLLFGLYVFAGQPVTPPVASAVVVDSAAYKAGLEPHDRIVQINNTKIKRFEDIQREIMVALDTSTDVAVERDGQIIEFKDIRPEKLETEDRFGFKQSRGVLGVVAPKSALDISSVSFIDGVEVNSPEQAKKMVLARLGKTIELNFSEEGKDPFVILVAPRAAFNDTFINEAENFELVVNNPDEVKGFIEHSIASAFVESLNETGSIVTKTFEALAQMFTGTRSAEELGGIFRIGAIAGDAAQAGWIALITFTALLSINLGLINLFPIPVLDGGHLLFYAIEAVKGSPLSESTQNYAFRFGFFLLIGLMIFANLNDLLQLSF